MSQQLPFKIATSEIAICEIAIVDDANDWPVPLVELTTVHNVRKVSDNAGRVALDLPELMGKETWLSVRGHGYGVEADSFGYQGVRIIPRAGERIVIRVHRELPAKRLGRITGAGMFAESQKLGQHLDWKEQGILGCDSAQLAVHLGKLYWAWGDTNLANYPLGLFHSPGATTQVQPIDNLAPPLKLRYDYFRDEEGGNVINLAHFPGDGPTWLSGLVSVPDKLGTPHLGAIYSKVKPPLEVYEKGICVWDDNQQQFKPYKRLWNSDRSTSDAADTDMATPEGHAVRWRDAEGEEWLLLGDPFPTLRCKATFEAWSDPRQWQAVNPPETILSDSGMQLKPHRGSIAWNGYRKKWIAIFTQMDGQTSFLGEIWYAEAETPFGPWQPAIHIVTHDQQTFYNPVIHAEFVHEDSPQVIFEGTFTKTFSNDADAVPRYEYNQILYRLDLDELK